MVWIHALLSIARTEAQIRAALPAAYRDSAVIDIDGRDVLIGHASASYAAARPAIVSLREQIRAHGVYLGSGRWGVEQEADLTEREADLVLAQRLRTMAAS